MRLPFSLVRRTQDQNLAESDFSKGITRDSPRWAIPQGGVYRAEDVLLDGPGMVRNRGKSVKLVTGISGTSSPTTVAISAPNFSSGQKVFAISKNGGGTYNINNVSTGTAGTQTSIPHAPQENPPFGEDLLIITDSSGTNAPRTVNSSVVVATLGGTPPHGKVSCVWSGYLLLANDGTNTNRIWFSAPSNFGGTWDTTNSWIDVDREILGLAVVAGVVLVFTRNTLSRILGSTPPDATSDGDLGLQPIANVGIFDARSIVVANDICYFANEDGIYATNGSAVECITTQEDNSGIGSLWIQQASGMSRSTGGVMCAGQWENRWLMVSIVNDATAQNWMWMYYIPSGAFVQITNHTALMFATSTSPAEKLWMATNAGGDSTHAQVLDLTNFWKPENGVADYDGTTIKGLIETRAIIADSFGMKRWGHGHVTFYMPNASDAATIKVATGIDGTLSFVTLDEGGTLSQAASMTRKRFVVNKDSQALTIQIQHSTANDVWQMYGIELDYGTLGVADGQ